MIYWFQCGKEYINMHFYCFIVFFNKNLLNWAIFHCMLKRWQNAFVLLKTVFCMYTVSVNIYVSNPSEWDQGVALGKTSSQSAGNTANAFCISKQLASVTQGCLSYNLLLTFFLICSDPFWAPTKSEHKQHPQEPCKAVSPISF